MFGAAGILFVHLGGTEEAALARERLRALAAILPHRPACPLQVLTTSGEEEEGRILDLLGAGELAAEALISTAGITRLPRSIFDPGMAPAVAQAVTTLAEGAPSTVAPRCLGSIPFICIYFFGVCRVGVPRGWNLVL